MVATMGAALWSAGTNERGDGAAVTFGAEWNPRTTSAIQQNMSVLIT